jgi:hypothetical protein
MWLTLSTILPADRPFALVCFLRCTPLWNRQYNETTDIFPLLAKREGIHAGYQYASLCKCDLKKRQVQTSVFKSTARE